MIGLAKTDISDMGKKNMSNAFKGGFKEISLGLKTFKRIIIHPYISI